MLEISHTAPVWADRLLVCLFWHKIHWKGRKYLTASSDSRLPHWRQEDFFLSFSALSISAKNLLCKYVRLLPVLKRFLVACEWAFSQSDADVTQINTYMFSTSCPELKPSGSSSLRGFSGLNLSCETDCGADTASLCLWLLFSLTTASWLLCTTLSWAVLWLDRRVSPASPLWELSANHRWSWRGLTR